MRILMFGTGPFAVPTFRWLLESPHDVPALVTRPVPPPGKRQKQAVNPMRDVALEANREVLDPPSVNSIDTIEALHKLSADLFVVCDYGQILSPDCLAAARLGGINLHGSLLPAYRGAAPINWAIYHGETTLGVSVIHMTPRLDAGNILTTATLELRTGESAQEVEPRLAELGVTAVREAIQLLDQWTGEQPPGEPQDESRATRAPRLKKEDGAVDWNRSAGELFRQVCALQPWPGTYTEWKPADRSPLRIILHRVRPVPGDPQVPPGQVLRNDGQQLVVQTGEGGLAIDQLQPAGKKPMAIADFLRGYPLQVGDRLE